MNNDLVFKNVIKVIKGINPICLDKVDIIDENINLAKDLDFDMYNCYKVDKEKLLYNNLFKEDLDATRERLDVREELQNLKLDKLVRFYEDCSLLDNI